MPMVALLQGQGPQVTRSAVLLAGPACTQGTEDGGGQEKMGGWIHSTKSQAGQSS